MKWAVFTVGKPALKHARLGAEDYLHRLQRYTSCDHRLLKNGGPDEIQNLMDAAGPGTLHLALDERGEALTTAAFVERLTRWQLEAVKRVHVYIGGADGWDPVVRERADLVWQLSALTLQHEIALVLFLEQLYRAHTILRGEPYHR